MNLKKDPMTLIVTTPEGQRSRERLPNLETALAAMAATPHEQHVVIRSTRGDEHILTRTFDRGLGGTTASFYTPNPRYYTAVAVMMQKAVDAHIEAAGTGLPENEQIPPQFAPDLQEMWERQLTVLAEKGVEDL